MIKKLLNTVLLFGISGCVLFAMDQPCSGLRVRRASIVDRGPFPCLMEQKVDVHGSLKDRWHIENIPPFFVMDDYILQNPPFDGVTYYARLKSTGGDVCLHSSWISRLDVGVKGKTYTTIIAGPFAHLVGERVKILDGPSGCSFGMHWGSENLLKFNDLILAVYNYLTHILIFGVQDCAASIYYVQYGETYYCLERDWLRELRAIPQE